MGNALLAFLLVLAVLFSMASFVGAVLIGIAKIPDISSMTLLMIWGGLCLAFLFSWCIGLLSDLQRSDAMSFKNLMHLPVSLSWVFLYNYLSSFVSLSFMLFVPTMLGICVALVIVKGAAMVLAFALVASFLIMVTAITYQLRGWLARLMEDKRRGRNIISFLTLLLILLAQAPNLVNLSLNTGSRSERRAERAELRELKRNARIDGPDQAAAQQELALRDQQEADEEAALKEHINLAALVLPIGWLPYGMRAAAERRWFASILCALGMLSIGSWSLSRAYRKTLQGAVKGGEPIAAVPLVEEIQTTEVATSGKHTRNFVQRAIPFVSPRTAGIARSNLISFLRAPEAKLMLLSPIVLLALYGYLLSTNAGRSGFAHFAPMLSLGAIVMGMLSVMQVVQNQFGLDRDGFRAYLLCPAPRYEVLLGKNIAMAPIALGFGFAGLILMQVFLPLGFLHFLGACFQLGSAYMLLCLLWNLISILAPIRLKDTGMKPANANFKNFLLHFVAMFLVPVSLTPLLAPAILEFLFDWQETPAFAGLHLIGLIAIAIAYRWMVSKQGDLLQEREQRILDVLTHE